MVKNMHLKKFDLDCSINKSDKIELSSKNYKLKRKRFWMKLSMKANLKAPKWLRNWSWMLLVGKIVLSQVTKWKQLLLLKELRGRPPNYSNLLKDWAQQKQNALFPRNFQVVELRNATVNCYILIIDYSWMWIKEIIRNNFPTSNSHIWFDDKTRTRKLY